MLHNNCIKKFSFDLFSKQYQGPLDLEELEKNIREQRKMQNMRSNKKETCKMYFDNLDQYYKYDGFDNLDQMLIDDYLEKSAASVGGARWARARTIRIKAPQESITKQISGVKPSTPSLNTPKPSTTNTPKSPTTNTPTSNTSTTSTPTSNTSTTSTPTKNTTTKTESNGPVEWYKKPWVKNTAIGAGAAGAAGAGYASYRSYDREN